MQRCPNSGVGDMRMVGFPDQLIHKHTTVKKASNVGMSSFSSTGTLEWVTPEPDLQMNKRLPPVDCPLLIKIPAGTRFPHFRDGCVYELGVPVLLRVRRENWERSKDATPTYVDEFGNKITGKFEWTYP